MRKTILLSALLIILSVFSIEAQKKKNMKNINPLLCNPIDGTCETPQNDKSSSNSFINEKHKKPIKVIYFTDPICSSCWAIEAQLRKMKLEYGNLLDIEYHMGGLLPDWSYNSSGISKPSDVAKHWDEVSIYYDMPIDGDVWLSDPLNSSYPPSIAFKAAQMQDDNNAILFLRKLREFVFLDKKNITKWEYIQEAAIAADLDTSKLKNDYESAAKYLFENDLQLGKALEVRGFPTMIFKNEYEQNELIYGAKPYTDYTKAIHKLLPEAKKQSYDNKWENLFHFFESLTAKEFSELSNIDRKHAEQKLNQLTEEGYLMKKNIKNGSIWYVK